MRVMQTVRAALTEYEIENGCAPTAIRLSPDDAARLAREEQINVMYGDVLESIGGIRVAIDSSLEEGVMLVCDELPAHRHIENYAGVCVRCGRPMSIYSTGALIGAFRRVFARPRDANGRFTRGG